MIRRYAPAVALLLFLTARADASTINLLLTTDHTWPASGDPAISFHFEIFESSANNWATFPRPDVELLASGDTPGLPGVNQFNISLEVDSLEDVYFKGWGFFQTSPPPFTSFYVAALPGFNVGSANVWGPPWISLADLGDGLSGFMPLVVGETSRGFIGTWELTAVPDPITPVPEPASMLLLGSGLIAVAARRYRRRNPDAN